MFVAILSYFVLALSTFVSATAASPAKRYEECDQKGAVASESAVCSRIGTGLINDGGNAADAVGFPTVGQPSERVLIAMFEAGWHSTLHWGYW